MRICRESLEDMKDVSCGGEHNKISVLCLEHRKQQEAPDADPFYTSLILFLNSRSCFQFINGTDRCETHRFLPVYSVFPFASL